MKHNTTSEDFLKIFADKETVEKIERSSLTKANDTYNKLLKKGIIKKRGYTLRGIEDAHLLRFSLNNF